MVNFFLVSVLALASSTSVWVVDETFGLNFDGSSDEGLGYVSIALDNVYLKNTPNNGDYSFHFWMLKRSNVDGAFVFGVSTTNSYCCGSYDMQPALFHDTDDNLWKLVGIAVSQTDDLLRLCVHESGTPVCSTTEKEDYFSLDDTFYLFLGRDDSSAYDGFNGIITSLKFYNNEALSDFSTYYSYTPASLCGGSEWGPSVYSCSDWGKVTQEGFKTATLGQAVSSSALITRSVSDPAFQSRPSGAGQTDVTVSGFFYLTTGQTGADQPFIDVTDTGSTQCVLQLLFSSTANQVELLVHNSAAACTSPGGNTLTFTAIDGVWIFVSVGITTSGSPEAFLYMHDGAAQTVTVTPATDSFQYSDLEVTLGGDGSSSNVEGLYYDFRAWYSYKGTTADCLAIYNAPLELGGPGCSGYTDFDCTGCSAGYLAETNYCEPCHEACSDCSDYKESTCSGCASGFYTQPGISALCFEFCPLGYSISGSTCAGSSGEVISIDLESNLQGTQSVGNGIELYYGLDDHDIVPDFDFFDPFPSLERGAYFNATKMLSFIKDSGNEFGLGVDCSFTMWVRPTNPGTLFTIREYDNAEGRSTSLLGMGIAEDTDNDYFYVAFGGYQQDTVYDTDQYTFSNDYSSFLWTHFSLTVDYTSGTDTTTLKYYANNDVYSFTSASYFRDHYESYMQIGFGGYGGAFEGFIYNFYVYNYALSVAEVSALITTSCSGSCSVCPSSGSCLSDCAWNEFPDTSGSCTACLDECDEGCVKADSCNFCFDELCDDCSSFAEGGCTECKGLAVLTSGACDCTGSNHIDSAGSCVACASPCAQCVDGEDGYCQECEDGYFLVEGLCIDNCTNGYYYDGTACKKCATGCTACSADGCSECDTGYFAYEDSCRSCGAGCISCGESGCEECNELLDMEDGQCVCEDGFYFDGTECVDCDSNCKTCLDSATYCTSCRGGVPFLMFDATCNSCQDFEGYGSGSDLVSVYLLDAEMEATLAESCTEICGDGLNMGNLECDDGNIVNGDGCSSGCSKEDGWSCEGGSKSSMDVCTDIAPFPVLTYTGVTSSGYSFILSFSELVVLTSSLEIEVEVADYTNYEWELDATELTAYHNAYELDLTMYESVAANTEVLVTVKQLSTISDENGNRPDTSTASTTVNDKFKYASAEVLEAAGTGVTAVTSGTASVGLSTSFFGGGDLSAVWGMVEAMQLINYLVLMGLKYPNNARIFLESMGFANLSFFPNSGEAMSGGETDYSEPPAVFRRQGYTTSFLINCGSILTLFLVSLFFLPVVLLLVYFFPTCRLFKVWKASYSYSIFLRISIESFLELTLSVGLQLRDMASTSFFDVLGLGLCGAVFIYLVGCLVLIGLKVSRQTAEVLGSTAYKTTFGSLYDKFNIESKLKRSFLVVQHARRLFFVVILLTLHEYVEVQALLLMAIFITVSDYVVLGLISGSTAIRSYETRKPS